MPNCSYEFEVNASPGVIEFKPRQPITEQLTFVAYFSEKAQFKDLAFCVGASDLDDVCQRNPSLARSDWLSAAFSYNPDVQPGDSFAFGPVSLSEEGDFLFVRRIGLAYEANVASLLSRIGFVVPFDGGTLVKEVWSND